MSRFQYGEVTIESGQSLSSEIDLSHHQLVAIQMPADWTPASLTFQARPGTARNATANETFQDVYDSDGNEVTVTAAEDRYVSLTGDVLDALTGCGALKVRSGTSGTPVVQDADRTLTLVLVPL